MKKSFGASLFALFLIPFVSAAYYTNNLASGLGTGMKQLIDIIESMLGPFFSVVLGGTPDLLFEKILILAVIMAIIYLVVSRLDYFKDNKVVIWIISISISLLSTRFMSGDMLRTILLPYSALGVSISAALPILIYFAFVQSFADSATIRKILWAFYIVVFIVIWSVRYDTLGDLSWIYMLSAVAAFLFLLFDGTIRKIIVQQELKDSQGTTKGEHIGKIRTQLGELRAHSTDYAPSVFKKLEKQYIDRIIRIEKAKL